jgi:hypothetical protein
MEHIIYVREIFQYEFNSDVYFVIGLHYLILFWECLIWSISYMSRTPFSIRIQWRCLICDQTTLFNNYFGNAYSCFQNYVESSQRFFALRKCVTCSCHSLDEVSTFRSWLRVQFLVVAVPCNHFLACNVYILSFKNT